MTQLHNPPSGGSNIERSKQNLTVTLDLKNSELIHDILEMLHHVANTTTCEKTKSYLVERLDYLTKQ